MRVSLSFDEFSGRVTQPLGPAQTTDQSDIEGPLVFTLDRRGLATLVREPELSGAASQLVEPLGLAHTFFPRVPGGGVTAGHSWVDTIRYQGTTGGDQEVSSVSILTYTVQGDTLVAGTRLLRMTSEGTTEQTSRGNIAGQSFQQSAKGDMEGWYLWDRQRGLVAASRMDSDLRGTMTVAAAPFPLGLRLRARTQTRLKEM